MAQQPRRTGRGFLWGLLFGAALLALDAINRLVVRGGALRLRRAPLGAGVLGVTLDAALLFVVALALYFLAGFVAARRSQSLAAGIVAGLTAGVLVGVVGAALALVLAIRLRDVRGAGLHILLPRLTLLNALLLLLRSSAIGAGMGALGALVGAAGRPAAPSPPVTGQPNAGQPAPVMPPAAYSPPAGQYTPPPSYQPGPDSPTTPSRL